MRRLSLNARLAQLDLRPEEIEVVLMRMTHPLLTAPIRLSTDNTERITADPLVYGTRSRWGGANPVTEPYLWVVASTLLPSDLDDAPAAASIVLENLDAGMAELLRSFTEPANVDLAVVLASSPDEVEAEYTDLRLVGCEITAGEITLRLSREEIELEQMPAGRMTRDRFPGVHR